MQYVYGRILYSSLVQSISTGHLAEAVECLHLIITIAQFMEFMEVLHEEIEKFH